MSKQVLLKVEENLLRIIEEVRDSGKVPDAFNSTFLALNPKNDKPVSFDEFRPSPCATVCI
jgi:hypothetical protein